MSNENLILAQKELDEHIAAYYRNNEDGGNYEEKLIVASRVAKRFNLDPVEETKLIF